MASNESHILNPRQRDVLHGRASDARRITRRLPAHTRPRAGWRNRCGWARCYDAQGEWRAASAVAFRINSHSGHADVARDPLMIRVVSPVREQVENHRETFLTGRQIAAIERV